MVLTWSIFVMSTCPPLPRDDDEGLDVVVVGGLLRNHRIARKPTRATAMSWGMFIEVCVSAIVDEERR